MRIFLAFAFLARATYAGSWENDLKRARQWTPRSEYRGQGSLEVANAKLNKHLMKKEGIKLKACEEFFIADLRELLRELHPQASFELKRLYSENDGRWAKFGTVAELEAHWALLGPSDDKRVRDAHCHEVVMWFVHHLTSDVQDQVMKKQVLPMLPASDHRVLEGSRDPSDSIGKFYDEKVTCQACHVGGIESLGLPEVAPTTEHAKKRRCYTNYKELFGIECGPCDGIAGVYTGDDDKYFTETPCDVVGTPAQIPESERVKVKLPSQFTVDVVGGSDRFGRTTNPVHDQLPGPIAKIYGQISGKWFMDAKPGADLWLLRHDTEYGSVTENGIPIPFIKPSVSEIHSQTAKQRSQNCTGPMVSLIHGMPSFLPGGCTCLPDPVGVPDIAASWAHGMAEMQYMGRIRLPKLEYLNVPIELDHWANWFFHIFMDTNKSVPHYAQAPSRLASAYAGTAVYANWKMQDPKIDDPTVWHRGIPTTPEKVGPDAGKYCMDTKKAFICSNISQDTFPPKGEPALQQPTQDGCPTGPASSGSSHHRTLPFFASALAVDEVLKTSSFVPAAAKELLV